MNVQCSSLSNGLRVATCAMPSVHSVSVGLWIGVGGRHEPAELNGISHFIEHLMFKGTRRRTAKDISEAIEGRGGYLNAFTQEESTCYYARVAADALPEAMDVLSDMYLEPRLAGVDIARERDVIIEEIRMYRDEPEQMVEEMMDRGLWRNHPLGRPLTGTPETLRRLTRRRIAAFREKHYGASNTLLVVAGRVEHGRAVELARRFFRRARSGDRPPFEPVTERVGRTRWSFRRRDTEQAHFEMGLRVFGRRDERRHALKLFNVVLGENMSSRLFQTVRERYGLAYSIHSSIHLHAETGSLVVATGTDRDQIVQAAELAVREMRRLTEQPLTAAELRRAKDYAIGQLRLGLESTTNQMTWAGESFMGYGRFIAPEETIRAVAAVTAEELQNVIAHLLRNPGLNLALIAPDLSRQEKERLLRCLDAGRR